MTRNWRHPAFALLVAALVAGCGGDDDAAAPGTGEAAACSDVEAPDPQRVDLDRPNLDPPPPGTRAVFETNCGTFAIELAVERAPKTAASFAHLVSEGVYEDTRFHRVATAPPIVQGGDPEGTGTGGPGYSVDEPPPRNLSYTEGVVAMAKTEVEPPGRSGSQFFIVTGADAGLPPDYALVGEVVSGMDVVQAIAELGVQGTDGPPAQPVVVERATLEER